MLTISTPLVEFLGVLNTAFTWISLGVRFNRSVHAERQGELNPQRGYSVELDLRHVHAQSLSPLGAVAKRSEVVERIIYYVSEGIRILHEVVDVVVALIDANSCDDDDVVSPSSLVSKLE